MMQALMIFIGYGTPVFIVVGVAVSMVLLGFFTASRAALLTFLFLVVMYCVPEISYGRLDEVLGGSRSFYSRGAGMLGMPAVIWALILATVWVHFSRLFAPPVEARGFPTLHGWFVAWALLFLAHLAAALLLDVPIRDAIGLSSFSNLLLIGLFAAFVLTTIRSEADVRHLLQFIVIVGFARAVYGLVRWAAFGGDPANAYANRHGLSLKLTYFDVYDSLICMLAICVALLLLFPRDARQRLAAWLRVFLWVTVAACTACIVLSFRRTAALGLVVAGIFILFQLPRRGVVPLIILAAPAGLMAAVYTVWMRLSQTKQAGAGGLRDLLFDVMPQKIGPDSPRLLELKLAFESFMESPLIGLGSWGNYKGWQMISWQMYEGGGGSYVHSGVLHIALKAGLFGLLLFVGMMLAYFLFWRRVRTQLVGLPRVLAITGVAGILFIAPDFVISTSITKMRAAFFIGLCLALPYVAASVAGLRWTAKKRKVAAAAQGVWTARAA